MNKKEIADRFLERADDIIEEIHARTMGEESPFPEASSVMITKYFDLYVEITKNLVEVGDIQRITANSTADIISMLKNGEITISDAKDLMQLLSTQAEIKSAQKMIEHINKLEGISDGNTYE